jgi:hypothetical protein
MIVQSVVRMALGIIFGTLVIIAVKGNVAFGTFKANNDMLFRCRRVQRALHP